MIRPLSYTHQSISQEDIDAVIRVLRSKWITQGPAIERFERAVADYCGAKCAVAVSSGTAALHIAYLAAGLSRGDELWTSPNTFAATANGALYCGASVNFVDIDSSTYNLSIEQLKLKLARVANRGTFPKIVVPVHFGGQSCGMEKIAELARRYKFRIIEDATHALGGSYKKGRVGSCQFSEMAVFSFHPVKIITTGEGGMVLTNRKDLYERLLRLRNHGITRDPRLMHAKPPGPWYYEQLELGFNYRITDIQAALGISQLKRVNRFIGRRRFLAERYDKLLRELPVTLPWQHPDSKSSWHLYVIRFDQNKIKKTSRQIMQELRKSGISANLHYIPVYRHPYYRRMGFKRTDYPETEKHYKEAMSLPLFYGLMERHQDSVVHCLRKILK